MRPSPFRLIISVLLLFSWGATEPLFACDKPGSRFTRAFIGAWKEEGGDRLLNIEADRVIRSSQGELVVRGLIKQDGKRLILRRMGTQETWTATLSGGFLRLESKEQKAQEMAGTYHRLDQVPEEVRLDPLPVAPSKPLPAAQIQALQDEITRRFKDEQALFKRAEKQDFEVRRMLDDNRVFLRRQLETVGWIDSARFGAKTSVYAVILAKHTRDLRLMLTVLPFAEHDLKDSGDGQTFAVLYDALQLDLGRKQLYGTQVSEDNNGPYVLAMEESREQVNRRLKEMGLPDLDEYLHQISQAFYAGRPVRIRQDG
jgi:hypothetical protein